MKIFPQVHLRKQELEEYGVSPNKLVMITNAVTMLAILLETVHDKEPMELVKASKQIKTFYGMDVVILQGDTFDYNKRRHFEIFEQLNKN